MNPSSPSGDSEPPLTEQLVDVPAPAPTWTVLVVEDTQDFREDAVRELQSSTVAYGSAPTVLSQSDFAAAEAQLLGGTIDVLVLDVQDASQGDDQAGERILANLKSKRFLPVVLWTAFAERVDRLASAPVVQVVGKDQGTDDLVEAVRASFQSDLPLALRGLTDHVREVTREYLWEEVAPDWHTLMDFNAAEKAQLLVGRLARSLELTAQVADEGLRGPLGTVLQGPSQWHPSRIYVIPPMGPGHNTGDLLQDPETNSYWLQLTPSCDLAQDKAERHLVVLAEPLLDVGVFAEWTAAGRAWKAVQAEPIPPGGLSREQKQSQKQMLGRVKDLRGRCAQVLRGAQDRYFHLPRYLTVPDLLLDMQKVASPSHDEVQGWNRVASLAPPWPQVLVSRFNRQVGRFGYDDPDVDGILNSLSPLTGDGR